MATCPECNSAGYNFLECPNCGYTNEEPVIFDVVAVAQELGVHREQMNEISSFLILNEDEFTTSDYLDFIEVMLMIRDDLIYDIAMEHFGVSPGALDINQRYRLWSQASGIIPKDDRRWILDEHIEAANRSRIIITQTFDGIRDLGTEAWWTPTFYHSMRH